MVNDKLFGAIMAGIGIVGIAIETYFLIITPLISTASPLGGLMEGIYWAIAIPLYLGVFGVLAIVVWIGFTMIRTPPPEAWSFDELDEEEEETKEETS